MKRLVHQLKPTVPGTQAAEVTWLDIQPPHPATINFLEQSYRFHPFILQELLVPTLRTKVERYDHYLFLVLHFPVYDKKTRETHSHELDVLATPDTVITVHPKSIEPLKTLFDKLNESEHLRGKLMGQGAGVLLYHIVDALIEALFPKVDHIAEKIDAIDSDLFENREREMIGEIFIVKRDIISFRRAVKPQRPLLESLAELGPELYGHQTRPHFRDLLGDYLRVWDHLENNYDMIQALDATNASLFSAKLNQIMKVLTIFATILLPLSLITQLFGVSILNFPLKDDPNGFGFMVGTMAAIALTMLVVFRWKRWL